MRMDGCMPITNGRAIVAKADLERFVLAFGSFHFSSLLVSSLLIPVPYLITVHALPSLDAHRHLDGEHGTRGTWTYGRFA
jgi:hypothetical protein